MTAPRTLNVRWTMDRRQILPRAVVKINKRIEVEIHNFARMQDIYPGKSGYSVSQHGLQWTCKTWEEAEPLIRRLVSQSWAGALLNTNTEAPLDIPADVKAYLQID